MRTKPDFLFANQRADQQLIKRCPRKPGAPPAAGPAPSILGLFRNADWLHPQRQAPGRPASKMLPPTQQRPAESQMSEAALKARQSPALSLFNRLDGLTHQLLATRDFFADWPQQMCRRIRARSSPVAGHTPSQDNTPAANGNISRRAANSSSSAECWNGRDFSG